MCWLLSEPILEITALMVMSSETLLKNDCLHAYTAEEWFHIQTAFGFVDIHM